MIGQAIYSLLNVSDVTDLVNGIYHTLAPEDVTFPYIIMNEQGVTENFKNNSNIRIHEVQIDVYCAKGKDGNAGFAQADAIRKKIEEKLNRFTGISGGKYIDTIYLEDIQPLFDPISQAARIIMGYRAREVYSEDLADPANYPQTVRVFVNGVLNQTEVINAYNDNTINITA